jgi:acyl-ACP thioesterase
MAAETKQTASSAPSSAFPRFFFSKNGGSVTETAFSPTITDIDLNGHVNNLNYVRWILSFMPENVCVGRKISILDTYFIASAMLGDKLLCKTATVPVTEVECVHTIVRATDGAELFRARTIWKSAAELSRDVSVD